MSEDDKEKGGGGVSLFKMIDQSQVDDNGKNFLIFFFSYPKKLDLCSDIDGVRKSVSISFHAQKLLKIISSTSILKEKIMELKISKPNSNYNGLATHCGLFFKRKDETSYCDLDDDVLLALSVSSKCNPAEDEQNDIFIDSVMRECKGKVYDDLKSEIDKIKEKINNNCNSDKKLNKLNEKIKQYEENLDKLIQNFPELSEKQA